MKKNILYLFLSIFYFAQIFSIYSGEWTDIIYPLPQYHSLLAISTVSKDIGWIGGSRGLILRTTNGGANWINVGNKEPIDSIHIGMCFAFDENRVYALGAIFLNNTWLFRTLDGGNNWEMLLSQPGGYFDNIAFKDSLNGILIGDPVGGRWSIWKTSDGGTTWDSTGLYLIKDGYDTSFFRDIDINGDTIWFGTSNSRIYYSYDFGNKWMYSNVICDRIETIGLIGYIGFAAGGMFTSCGIKTTNGGINWYSTDLIPGQSIMYITHIDDKFWVSTGNKIYCSYDNGNNFFLQHTRPISEGYWQIDLKKKNNEIFGWAVTNTGTISKYHEFIGVKNISSEVPDKFMLYQNYPNPFNPTTDIIFSIPVNTHVKITIFTITGAEVATIMNDFKMPGDYSVKFNGTNLASGIYIYRIEAGSFTESKKMLLIK